MTGLRIILLGLPAVLMLGARPVSAGPLVFDNSVSGCTGNNCSSLTLPGSVLAFGPSAASFVIEAFATSGQCMRLDVTSQDVDLEIVAVAPNGQVFRNDDQGGAGGLRPLVKIDATPNNGWYTVQVQQFAGSAVGANFVLRYGRYNTGNPNCATPTEPVLSAEAQAEEQLKQDSGVTPPQPNTPGSAE
jgi:hypothetical protein